MQYIIMFLIVVGASVSDVVTGFLKAHIVEGYDSTIMKKGLYSKFLNWTIMATAIGFEVGMQLLGRFYECEELAAIAGAIPAVFVFTIIVLMELVSIFENFAIANPNSPLAKAAVKRLKKLKPYQTEEEDKDGH